MKQRSIATCIVLSIITCGIYNIFWFIALTDETNIASEESGTSGGVAFLLTLVTCGIYYIYWAYKLGEKIKIAKQKHGINTEGTDTAVLYLVLSVFGLGIIAHCLAQSELNKMV